MTLALAMGSDFIMLGRYFSRFDVGLSLSKIKHTMCNCGALTIPELQQKAKITLVSATSIVEGGAHDVVLKDAKEQK